MSRIFCTWELGSGSGHVLPLARVLGELARRGHGLSMATRSLPAAAQALGSVPVRLFQSPMWPAPPPDRRPGGNYAQMLEKVGYDTRDGIAALLGGWRSLLALAAPDLVLAEHSPTALLAARIEGIPCVVTGTGFTLPPLGEPMPTTLPGSAVSTRALQRSEAAVLERINAVLTAAGAAPLATLAELLAARERVLWTLPELDHYAGRDGDRYSGPVIATADAGVDWPPGDGARVFAYYHARYPTFAAVLDALKQLGLPSLLVAGGGNADAVKGIGSPSLRVTARPVDLDQAAREARLVLSHTGFNTVATGLLAGCPQLLVPLYVEQQMLAFQLREHGLGEVAPAQAGAIAKQARNVLASGRLASAARRFAERYRDHDRGLPIADAVGACERVLAAAA